MDIATTVGVECNHPEIGFSYDERVIQEEEARFLISLLESKIRSGTRYTDGQIVRLGSMRLMIKQEKNRLRLWQPDLHSLPLKYENSVTHALLVLRIQQLAIKQAGEDVLPAFPDMNQTILTCNNLDLTGEYGICRFNPEPGTQESGWFLGCLDREHNHQDPANIKTEPLYQYYCRHPHLLEFFGFPMDTLVIFSGNQVKKSSLAGKPITINERYYSQLEDYWRKKRTQRIVKETITATRMKFENERLDFSRKLKRYNLIKPPSWLKRQGNLLLKTIYREQKVILSQGRLVWGVVVQANRQLFEPGDSAHPAVVVYSLDPYFDSFRDDLKEIASRLFSLKERDLEEIRCQDKSLVPLAQVIKDEFAVLFNQLIPFSVTYGREVYFTTVMVHREHLPAQYLVHNWFPLVVHPLKTRASLILPGKYWDDSLLKEWGYPAAPF